MTFKDLKDKYSQYDFSKSNEAYITIGSFLIGINGDINLSRGASDVEGYYIDIYCNIAKNRTMEQLDKFIESIL